MYLRWEVLTNVQPICYKSSQTNNYIARTLAPLVGLALTTLHGREQDGVDLLDRTCMDGNTIEAWAASVSISVRRCF